MAYEEKYPEARHEGFWTRLRCSVCDEFWEVEDDTSDGDEVECEACGAKLEISGRG